MWIKFAVMFTGPAGMVRAVMAALVFAMMGAPELIAQLWNTRSFVGNLEYAGFKSLYMAFLAALENAMFVG